MTEASRAEAILGCLMLAFDGHELDAQTARRLASRPPAGMTLFRAANVASPSQLQALTDAIQRLAPPDEQFLVALDHEGGQLLGLGPQATPFPGNMALGAVGDPALAERVGAAIGRELRAAGVNVDYAPVCDLATQPRNPAMGVRSFGDDPVRVAPLVAGFVRGLAASGVAATLKHFPGLGEAAADSHRVLPCLDGSPERFRAVELAPFRSGIEAGAGLVMSAHVDVPALTGVRDLPATLSPRVMSDLLRDELGFEGVTISDAFDMGALGQGMAQVVEAVAALRAGVDLILLTPSSDPDGSLGEALRLAAARGLVAEADVARSRRRIERLRRRLGAGPAPGGLDVIGSATHRALAAEVARRSVTLVRDDAGLLPLRPGPDDTIAVVTPRPADLTPADTSSLEAPAFVEALRRRHAGVVAHLTAHAPSAEEISAARELVAGADLAIVGSTAATLEPAQGELVRALLATGTPAVTVALRLPWDLAGSPAAATAICTYAVVEPSMHALAEALFAGPDAFLGHLPVALAAGAAA